MSQKQKNKFVDRYRVLNNGVYRKGHKPWTTGKHLSKQTKKKISEAHRGKKMLPFSKETRNRMSLSHKGEKCYCWKGGITKDKDYVSWLKNKRNRMPKIGSHSWGEWELLKNQYGYRCPSCGKTEPSIKLTEDHIIPLSKGGTDYIENIQPLCKRCNCKKHTKIIKYEN